MKKYYDLDLIERDVTGMKWGLWFDKNEPVEVVFNQANEFVGFRLKEHAESYDPNWEVGEWEDYTIRGEYKNNSKYENFTNDDIEELGLNELTANEMKIVDIFYSYLGVYTSIPVMLAVLESKCICRNLFVKSGYKKVVIIVDDIRAEFEKDLDNELVILTDIFTPIGCNFNMK